VDFLQGLDVGSLLIQFAVLLFSLSIHEASHAWVADYFGDYTARYLGRVSLNPIAHIDPVGTILFPIVGMVMRIPLIGWAKPVPINSVHLRNPRRDQIFISLAGPGSNLVAAATAFLALACLKLGSAHAGSLVNHMIATNSIPREQSVIAPLLGILFFALIINMALALFNFIPIPPLDGHWVLYGLLPYNAAKALERVGSYGIFLLYGLMLIGEPVLKFIFSPIRQVLILLYWL
jgi:Zn-dependent protease